MTLSFGMRALLIAGLLFATPRRRCPDGPPAASNFRYYGQCREGLNICRSAAAFTRASYGSFDISSIPAIEQGAVALALLGDEAGLRAMAAVVAGTPESAPWAEHVEQALGGLGLMSRIRRVTLDGDRGELSLDRLQYDENDHGPDGHPVVGEDAGRRPDHQCDQEHSPIVDRSPREALNVYTISTCRPQSVGGRRTPKGRIDDGASALSISAGAFARRPTGLP